MLCVVILVCPNNNEYCSLRSNHRTWATPKPSSSLAAQGAVSQSLSCDIQDMSGSLTWNFPVPNVLPCMAATHVDFYLFCPDTIKLKDFFFFPTVTWNDKKEKSIKQSRLIRAGWEDPVQKIKKILILFHKMVPPSYNALIYYLAYCFCFTSCAC